MSKRYALIDRATGSLLKAKVFDNIKRVFNKSKVWIEIVQEDLPVHNTDTHKVERTITQPDLSDLDVDVPPATQRIQGYDVVALDAQELADVVTSKVRASDEDLFQMVEDIMVAIAANPSPLKRNDFSISSWNIINARRALRGEASI
jgi:hypothetical protein